MYNILLEIMSYRESFYNLKKKQRKKERENEKNVRLIFIQSAES